ncbi:LacI family DNA-binding transcriptional regulator, partial [Xanthomonas vesicatoria]|uniref:LacI family DNA-binding transcriptional regulator n=1 Tax=Xanthomonas vesicatoria TaxID=56460 RepID=UPI003CCEA185
MSRCLPMQYPTAAPALRATCSRRRTARTRVRDGTAPSRTSGRHCTNNPPLVRTDYTLAFPQCAAMAKPSERTTPNARPQMADIARMAGVSESTVSRALAGSPVVAERTRAYIKQIAAEAGYQVDPVARSLRAKRSNTVSVAVPMMHALDQPLSDPFLMT